MFSKVTDREKQFANKIKMLQEEIDILKNQNSYMAESSKRWARKFQDPKYAVPAQIIEKMEKETEQYKQKARAEREELRARVAILTDRVVELTAEKTDGLFGSSTGNAEVTYDFAASHVDAVLTQDDYEATNLELSKAWSRHMQKFAN
ncbi:MAG: hypothetical protein MK188_07680 [Gammaproteobacteria bacterium]|nr:hypothetical protein [Gammaproteobacteria bacterium]